MSPYQDDHSGSNLPHRSRLRSGEKVIWRGKPVLAPFVVPSFVSIPFGLVPMFFALQWMSVTSQAPWPFTLAGFIPLLFAVFSFGQPLLRLIAYKNTEYLITDQRIIIRSGTIGLDTRSIELDRVREVIVNVGAVDGLFRTGTLRIVTTGYNHGYSHRYAYGGYEYSGLPGPASLKEPYEVQQLLQNTLALKKVLPSAESNAIPGRRCPKCGGEVSGDVYFCPSCGASLAKTSQW